MKRKCVHLLNRPIGGIGNRLFNYNFLFQISKMIDFKPKITHSDEPLISNLNSRCSFSSSHFFKTRINNHEFPLLRAEMESFLQRLSDRNKCIFLEDSFLGEYFFEISKCDPKIFFPLLLPDNIKMVDRFVLGMHFRGKDFASWNPRSILKPEYYLNSFEYLRKFIGSQEIQLNLFTDDLDLESINIVRKNLASEVDIQIFCSTNPVDDLKKLASSNAIVSSPSTFAIWSGILSENSIIIHSKDWVEHRSNVDDRFWIQVLLGGGNYYKIDRLIE